MRFLVNAITRQPVPPDLALGLLTATRAWIDGYLAAGKMEQAWGLAGSQGGGGILNVDSHEELDQIVGEYPFQPFAEIQIHPMADIWTSLDQVERQLQAAVQAGARPPSHLVGPST